MMIWYGNDMSGWAWVLMAVGAMACWALVIAGTVAVVRHLTRHEQPIAPWPTPDQVLADRFARGEIDEPGYRWRRDALSVRSGPMATSAAS